MTDATKSIDPGRTHTAAAADATRTHSPKQSSSAAPTIPGYEILEAGQGGGQGTVFKARQIRMDRVVALKLLHGGANARDASQARFLAEAMAVAAVDHPHVVKVFDSGDADGQSFIAMEYLPGGTLAERLSNDRKRNAEHCRDIALMVRKLAEGVQAAHDRQIVHRDLKPANVMFDSQGEPRITDFGLAKRAEGDLTATGQIMGTYAYMAPEQAKGESKFVGPAADVWALGVILYEALSGRRPFGGSNEYELLQNVIGNEPSKLRSISREIPAALDIIASKCLSKEPSERYASAKELADDLDRWLNGVPILASRPGLQRKMVAWIRRKPLQVAALFLLVFASGLSALLIAARQQNRLIEEAKASVESEKTALAGEKETVEKDLAKVASEKQALDLTRLNYERYSQSLQDYTLFQAHHKQFGIRDSNDARNARISKYRDRTYEEMLIADIRNFRKKTWHNNIFLSQFGGSEIDPVILLNVKLPTETINSTAPKLFKKHVAIAPTANAIAVETADGVIDIFHNQRFSVKTTCRLGRRISKMIWSEDGHWLLLTTEDNAVGVFDMAATALRWFTIGFDIKFVNRVDSAIFVLLDERLKYGIVNLHQLPQSSSLSIEEMPRKHGDRSFLIRASNGENPGELILQITDQYRQDREYVTHNILQNNSGRSRSHGTIYRGMAPYGEIQVRRGAATHGIDAFASKAFFKNPNRNDNDFILNMQKRSAAKMEVVFFRVEPGHLERTTTLECDAERTSSANKYFLDGSLFPYSDHALTVNSDDSITVWEQYVLKIDKQDETSTITYHCNLPLVTFRAPGAREAIISDDGMNVVTLHADGSIYVWSGSRKP